MRSGILTLLTLMMLGTVQVGLLRAQSDTLTNQSVLDMVASRLPKDLITQKIKETPARFNITSNGLVTLNNAKVPKDIIKLMMDNPEGSATPKPELASTPTAQAAAAPTSPMAAAPVLPPPPAAPPKTPPPPPPPPPDRIPKALLSPIPREPGIHMRAVGAPLTILEPTTYSGASNSGNLGSTLSLGISRAKIKAHLLSPTAPIRTRDASAEFYFVIPPANATNSWSGRLTSPSEFALIRLDRKSDHRELTIASGGAGGMQVGADDKAAVPVTLARIRLGVYRVIPVAPLPPGEYAFLPLRAGGTGSAETTILFDFGVDSQ